jgi:hypothetical protein
MLKNRRSFVDFVQNNFDLGETYHQYVSRLSQDGEWATNEIIFAVSQALGISFRIVFSDVSGHPESSVIIDNTHGTREVALLYDGSTHYNGLVPK